MKATVKRGSKNRMKSMKELKRDVGRAVGSAVKRVRGKKK
jgi:hypothetical protein